MRGHGGAKKDRKKEKSESGRKTENRKCPGKNNTDMHQSYRTTKNGIGAIRFNMI